MSVCKRAAQDQPQHSVGQLPPQVCEHVCSGVRSVVFLVKLLDRVWELFKFDQKLPVDRARVRGQRTVGMYAMWCAENDVGFERVYFETLPRKR